MKLFKHFRNQQDFNDFLNTISPEVHTKEELDIPYPLFVEMEIDLRFWSLSEIMKVVGAVKEYMDEDVKK